LFWFWFWFGFGFGDIFFFDATGEDDGEDEADDKQESVVVRSVSNSGSMVVFKIRLLRLDIVRLIGVYDVKMM